jgi:tetratricopeptide (TPR) repeat protein
MERSSDNGSAGAPAHHDRDDRDGRDDRDVRDDRDERWYLTDERDFLRRSLDDADREHEAGDLSDEDHALLTARDTARLVEVEAALATLGPEAAPDSSTTTPAPAETPGRRPLPLWRRIGIVAACLLIVTGVAVLIVHSVQSRQPGQFSSGSVTEPQEQQIANQLSQALVLNSQGDQAGALDLYNKVLSEDPTDPAALASAGFIEWNLGSTNHVANLTKIGRAEVEKAVQVEPSYYEGHLYLGLILYNQDHNNTAAVTQFNEFLADNPPTAMLSQVASAVDGAYQAAGDPVPAPFVPAAGSGQTSAP